MIETFFIFCAIAFTVASWSYFFDECLQEGDIFDFYGKKVKKEIWHNQNIEKKLGYLKSCCQATESDVQEYESQKLKVPKWKMPIGGCVICTNTWWTIFTSAFIFFTLLKTFDIPFDLFRLGCFLFLTIVLIALSHTFLRILLKL